jgi:transcriptional regulator NrdR family protein
VSHKLPCAFCGHDTKVMPWRSYRWGESHKRRRSCPQCLSVVETSERVDKVVRGPLQIKYSA